MSDTTFDQLIEQAMAQKLTGWDFSWLSQRTSEEPIPWDYEDGARTRLVGVEAVLDMDTGGGELLSRLGPFPMVTWATEGYPPNIEIARTRLDPMGIQVADVSGLDGLLPFVDDTFDLVLNRHGSLDTDELYRVLRPGGRFYTQQVGGENMLDLNRALGQDPVSYPYAQDTLPNLLDQLHQAGLEINDAREVFPKITFKDIAGIVFYLNAIPWQIEGFTVDAYRDQLLDLHKQIQASGGFTARQHRILIEAVKPVI